MSSVETFLSELGSGLRVQAAEAMTLPRWISLASAVYTVVGTAITSDSGATTSSFAFSTSSAALSTPTTTVFASTVTPTSNVPSVTSTTIFSFSPTSTSVLPTFTSASFPPVGSIPRDFSPSGLEKLWDLVGPVAPPPFTTTPVPKTPIILPSPPPLLYPTWYAPEPSNVMSNLSLPKGFKFGVATAAYQVEGAAKSEGKGPTIWDWAPRQPGVVADGTNGDITDLQYLLYKEDTARVAALGVTDHSFSISWARIFPFGVKGSPLNQQGLDHYSDLIDYSISAGVNPVVTLFHWDLPLANAAYYGGFTSPQIVDDFVNYATTVFKAFNGRVKTWYTFNEPHVYCGEASGYPFDSQLAPGVNASTAFYQCAYNLLKAHAGAVKAFRQMNISGEIAFKNDGQVGTPWRTNTTEDSEAVERSAAFGIGLFSNPVYVNGDWHELIKQTVPESYLPRLTEEEMRDIKGSADFFAIDAYTSQFVAAPPNGIAACVSNISDPNWPGCNVIVEYDSNFGWPAGIAADPGSPWLQATPLTLRYALKQIQQRWPTKKIYISEYGFSEPNEGQRTDLFRILDDTDRTSYFMTYLGEALLAIHEDGIPLEGAFSWAMVDNAEWSSGLSTRFGIQYVNYTTLKRTYKRSALALSEFFKSHL